LVLFTVTYFGLNSWLIAIIIAVEKGENVWAVWRRGFIWLSLNYFCGASVAVLLIGSNRSIDVRFVGLIVPVLLVLYFTFKTTMQRVEDANKHVEQLNKLYLSTIETLAMAVDAKDQVTHGHIRRVQSYATQLARKIGIRDEHLLKAIEAAALLHDMGKLAIPEHILNKPGKLTPAEFDKMKLHASIGAEILSAIDFPYPVVPIVRHHHENWDGTGYPDGLRGTDVPIGARILSVVDCFDALTSDRPYRPRLSDEDALTILIERRGSMYDPLVVDTFVRVYRSISPEPSQSALSKEPPRTIAAPPAAQNPPSTRKDLNETADANGMLALYDLAHALAGNVSVADAGDIIAKHLKRLIPFSVCIFYLKDRNTDELEAIHAVGDRSTELLGVRIALGQRLSGWVAANRQTICNSDSALDLWDLDRPDLRSCLSAPLVFGDTLIGVLTLHSTEANSFSEDHRRIIDLASRTLSDTFRRSLDFDVTSRRDPLTGLPASDQLDQLLRAVSINTSDAVERSSLILIDVLGLAAITERLGTQAGNNALLHVVQQLRSGMRASDLLFRSGSDELVAFLPDSDTTAGVVLADRMREHMDEHPLVDGSGPLSTDLQFTCVPVPDGDYSLHEVLERARANARTAITLDACPVS